jgi:hypothetical protein
MSPCQSKRNLHLALGARKSGRRRLVAASPLRIWEGRGGVVASVKILSNSCLERGTFTKATRRADAEKAARVAGKARENGEKAGTRARTEIREERRERVREDVAASWQMGRADMYPNWNQCVARTTGSSYCEYLSTKLSRKYIL